MVQSARTYDRTEAEALSEALTNHSFVVIVYNHGHEVGSGSGKRPRFDEESTISALFNTVRQPSDVV